MMLRRVPPAIRPTVITTGSKMSNRRVTIVCSEVIISAVAAIGSRARCGIDPWPPSPRTVTCSACEADIIVPGAAHEPARGDHRREHVHPVRRVGAPPGRVEHALLDHHAGAVPALLARLEHEHHVAAQVVAVLGEQASTTDEGRRVQVVAAGVHRAVGRREVEPGLLVDRQRVHVRAQQHGLRVVLVAGSSAQHRRHRGGTGPGRDLQTEAVELAEDALLGAWQVQPDLRLLVQLAAKLGEIVGHAARVVVQVHGSSLLGVPGRCRGRGDHSRTLPPDRHRWKDTGRAQWRGDICSPRPRHRDLV